MQSPVNDDYRARQAAKAVHNQGRSLDSSGNRSPIKTPTTPPFESKFLFSVNEKNGCTTSFDNSLADPDSMVVAVVEKHQDKDQIQFSPFRRFIARFYVFTALIPLLLTFYACYLQYFILVHHGAEKIVSPLRLRLAWALWGMEVITSPDALFGALFKTSTFFGRWRPTLRLLGNNVPSVDVMIPVCNEKLDIIQDTVRGALNVDYPRHRFRVIVTDDGANPKLEAWILQMSESIPNLYYTARVKSGAAGYKAGNINHAVAVSDTLPGGSAEMIAGLDADMIPERRWLRAVTAHLVRDPKMGMVCPTQLFYNVPVGDSLNQARSVDWLCLDIVRDHAGAGWNLGSGWVVRRTALDDINGFPTDCLVEDICSSMLKIAAGWRTAYIPEGLQYGLVPETYGAHVKQLCRWYIGGCQMFVKFGGYLSRRVTKRMPWHLRLLGLSAGVNVHTKPQLGSIGMMLSPMVFFTGTQMVYFRNEDELKLLFRLHCLIMLSSWLHKLHMGLYRVAVVEVGLAQYMSPYYSLAWARTFLLPERFGGKKAGFTPTGSIANNLQERNPARRAGVKARLHHTIFDCGAWVHLLAILIFIGTVWIQIHRVMVKYDVHGDEKQMWIDLIKTVLWPSQPWLISIAGLSQPFIYALFPPSVPERDALMGRKEGEFGARYPTEHAKKTKWSFFTFDFVWFYTIYMMCIGLAFLWSLRWFSN